MALESTCNDGTFVVVFPDSSPVRLRLLYRLAGSMPPDWGTCVSSALLARLCPDFVEVATSEPLETPVWPDMVNSGVERAAAER